MKITDGGVTAAKGFKAAGVEAGIKYENRKDMAMIFSDKPCTVAGTFTSNVVKAAPVIWDMKVVRENKSAQAVVVIRVSQTPRPESRGWITVSLRRKQPEGS